MFSFLNNKSCAHEKITPNMISGYCPDCGEYIKNQWYITRCACCGIKQKTIVIKGKILADIKFCKNCGNNTFTAIELNGINIVDIHYAVLQKQTVVNKKQNFIQTWIDQNTYSPKLLPSY